jgi:hypothetical protein
MPPVGLELKTTASQRPQIHDLDSASTEIGKTGVTVNKDSDRENT